MQVSKGTILFRTLVLYLVLRALCAPIALRGQAVGSALGEGFVLRVCSWPAHKHAPASMQVCEALIAADRLVLCGAFALLPLLYSLLSGLFIVVEPPRSRLLAFRDRSLGRLLC